MLTHYANKINNLSLRYFLNIQIVILKTINNKEEKKIMEAIEEATKTDTPPEKPATQEATTPGGGSDKK